MAFQVEELCLELIDALAALMPRIKQRDKALEDQLRRAASSIVLTVNGDHTARLWTLPLPRGSRELIGHADEVNSAQFSHDGTRVVTGSDDGTAMIWNAARSV